MIYDDFKQLLLVDEQSRQALLTENKWFFHDTSLNNMKSIRSTSLEPRDPGIIDPDALRVIDSTLGRAGRKVICLKSIRSHVQGSLDPFASVVRLAIYKGHLPSLVGIDLSNTATKRALGKIPPGTASSAAFIKAVQETESFVCYDAINASLLRVCPAGSSAQSNPAGWPVLTDAKHDSEIARF
jgi:hypothetical protein